MTYTVVRTARKSLCISVSENNEITVRCPKRLSENEIEKFVKSKTAWLNKVLKSNEINLLNNKSVLEYKEIFVNGKKLPLVISDRNEITDTAVYIKNLSCIKKTLQKYFLEDFINKAKVIAELAGFRVKEYSVKAYKSRWGCCDRSGKITFNYLLFMLPAELQRYIIIHELCHTAVFNHSTRFWELVGKFEPDYRIMRKRLKSFNFIINLY